MVTGGDSYSYSCGFKSQHTGRIFFHICSFEQTKINEKEAGDGRFEIVYDLTLTSFYQPPNKSK